MACSPRLWSGSYARPSSHGGAPGYPPCWVGLSGMAPTNARAPTSPEPSFCGWAACWAPARCRTSATACGSSLGQPAHETRPLWTPEAPTAMAEVGQALPLSVPAERLHLSPRSVAGPPACPAPRAPGKEVTAAVVQASEEKPLTFHTHQVPQPTLDCFGRINSGTSRHMCRQNSYTQKCPSSGDRC